jgi:hypothetical protein
MPGASISGGAAGLELQASTGAAGFALQDATSTILSWTAPNDGNFHRAIVLGIGNVTVAATGGQVNLVGTDIAGNSINAVLLAAGLSTIGTNAFNNASNRMLVTVKPGTTLSITQESALTAGAVTVFAEIWGL